MICNLRTTLTLILLAAAGATGVAQASPTSNGWDTDHIYVIRGDSSDGEIRRLNENDPTPIDSDAGRLGADLPADGKAKSMCFSNSPQAGVNTPAGARLFGVVNYPADVSEPNNTSFTVHEFDSSGNEIRFFYAGLAGGGTGNAELNGPDGRVRVGNIRYNPAKNTIAVAANIALQDASHFLIPGTQRAMVYEFALPDWQPPAQAPFWRTPTLVQRYELPGRAIGDNGNINSPPVIDFDRQGNMYVFGRFYDANTDGFRDVIRFSTLGRNAGLTTYTPSITGASAANLLINGITECNEGANCSICNNNIDWQCGGGGWGMAVRYSNNNPNLLQLVITPERTCESLHTLVYDVTQRVGGGSTGNLVLAHRLPNLCDIPRQPRYAQRDEHSQKIYFGHNQGNCCDPGGNFMYLNDDYPTDTMTKDVGYSLFIACSPDCDLNRSWDAASPPALPGPAPSGACCLPGQTCQSSTHAACTATDGIWQGAGTVCGQFACPLGACCGACSTCSEVLQPECSGGKVWQGAFATCAQSSCGSSALCATPPVDGDCDGDVDADDFAIFQLCYSPDGPIPASPANCGCFDRVAPFGQINKLDFEAFANCDSGADVPAGPCP